MYILGLIGGRVVPTMNILPPGSCAITPNFSVNAQVPGSLCEPDVRFHRLMNILLYCLSKHDHTSILFLNHVAYFLFFSVVDYLLTIHSQRH